MNGRTVWRWSWLVLAGLLALSIPAAAMELATIDLVDARTPVDLLGSLTTFVEEGEGLGPEDVLRRAAAGEMASEPSLSERGFDPRPHWGIMRVVNHSPMAQRRLIEIGMPFLDEVDCFFGDPGPGFRHSRAGDRVARSEWAIPARTFLCPIDLAPGGTATLLIRVRTASSLRVTADLWTVEAFLASSSSLTVRFGFLHGATVFAILFLMFAVRIVPSRAHRWFLIHLIASECFLASAEGFTGQLLSGLPPAVGDHLTSASLIALTVTGYAFVAVAFEIRRRVPLLFVAFMAMIAVCIGLEIATLAFGYGAVALWVNLTTIGYPTIGLGFGIAGLFGRAHNRWLLFAVTFLSFMGVVSQWPRVFTPSLIDTLPQGTSHALVAILAMGFAFDLVRWFARSERERHRAQRQLLDRARAEERNLADEVARRTGELAENQRRLEEALAGERRLALEQRSFLAMVAHEFRGPLNAIATAARVVGFYLPTSSRDARDELDSVHDGVARLTALTDAFLGDAWLEAASLSPTREPVDLAELARSVVGGRGNARVAFEIVEPVEVTGDRSLLRAALTNLVDNALKYSPAPLPVTVRLERVGHRARFSVRDHGEGIPPTERSRLFDRYYRSDRTRMITGAGLGLSITRRIAELHHGSVTVEPGPDDGNVFTLSLPLDHGEADAD